MSKLRVQAALQETVEAYNKWNSSQTKHKYNIKTHGEFRGIVFNMMRKLIREAGFEHLQEKGWIVKKHFTPEDLICCFTPEGYLTHMSFIRPNTYCSQMRLEILCTLQEAVVDIRYEIFTEDVAYKISDFINQIKKF